MADAREFGQPRVVLDTNVVLSALLFRQGRLAALRQAWQTGLCLPVASPGSVRELTRVLSYPRFGLDAVALREALQLYVPHVEVHSTMSRAARMTHLPRCRDSNDQMFLELAQSAQVDALVTGDSDLLVLRDSLPAEINFRICTPHQLLEQLRVD